MRRVVTGHDADGKAVFVSDAVVAPILPALMPGVAFHQLWGGDEPRSFPDAGDRPDARTYFPPIGGFRFGCFTMPPVTDAHLAPELDLDVALAEFEAVVPGLLEFIEPDGPGMHTTPTIDFDVVLSGEVVLELDDGATVHLQAGDVVVQNGTRHRWSNPGDVPATVALFSCGAHHANTRVIARE